MAVVGQRWRGFLGEAVPVADALVEKITHKHRGQMIHLRSTSITLS